MSNVGVVLRQLPVKDLTAAQERDRVLSSAEMNALGQKRTSCDVRLMSALPPKSGPALALPRTPTSNAARSLP
jgi:hypothetical protein